MTTLELPLRAPAARSLLVATRPRQWVKNVLVFAAPLAGGALTQRHVALNAGVTFVAFVCASAACYLINDVYDVESDRLHPDKRQRPVASGALAVNSAVAVAVGLLLLAVLITLPLDRELATVTLLAYVGTVVLYGARLKNVPGVELAVLAGGFVLRPLAGAAATGVPPSPWFLAVCCLGALTVALGKRQVELIRLPTAPERHRRALGYYSLVWLRRTRIASAIAMTLAYTGWAAARPAAADRWLALATVIPVVAGTVRLGRLNDAGVGDAPEVVLLTDRWMKACCLVWLALFALAVANA